MEFGAGLDDQGGKIDFFEVEPFPVPVKRPGSPDVFTEFIKRSAAEHSAFGFEVHQDDVKVWRGRLRGQANVMGYRVAVRIGPPNAAGVCEVRFRSVLNPAL